MSIWESVLSALRAIGANKLRSMLTMLGVVIGIGSVIAMIGIGQGTTQAALSNLEKNGTNMLIVWPNWRIQDSGGEVPRLTQADVELIKRNVPLVKYITGSNGGNADTHFADKSHTCRIQGAEPVIRFIRNATDMAQGTWYTDDDEKHGRLKCVLGYDAYKALFGSDNAIGSSIRIKNDEFEVVGVIDFKGGAGFWNPDDQIYVPLSVAMTRLFGDKHYDSLSIEAMDPNLLLYTQNQIETLLSTNKKSAGGQKEFNVLNQGDQLKTLDTQTRLLSILLAGIASVSLLVGGIGIMNIMLVSVTERTREIGLRKALGAKRDSILGQFLLESVVMCFTGGLIGIVVGIGLVKGVAALMNVPPIVSVQSILLAFAFSAFVGIFFGLYPAIRASALQPIEALRYE